MRVDPEFRSWRRFVRWFAWQDLTAAEAWSVSRTMIWTIAFATFGAVIAVILPIATHRVRMERLQANPMARSVWIRDRLRARFDKPALDNFEAELRKNLPRPDLVNNCQLFKLIKFRCYYADGNGLLPDDAEGRTLADSDELFRHANQLPLFRFGTPFTSANEEGVIVSPSLLKDLGYPKDVEPGSVLTIEMPNSGKERELKIVGVTHDPLPLKFLFAINHSQYVRLLAEDPPDVLGGMIHTGPIGHDWPDHPEKLHKASKAMYENFGCDGLGDKNFDGTRYYKFSLKNAKLTIKKSHWTKFMSGLHGEITKEHSRHDPFLQFHVVGAPDKEMPTLPGPPDWISIYVAKLDALTPVVDVLDAAKPRWVVSEMGRVQRQEITRAFHVAFFVLGVLAVIFCFACGVSLYSIHSLRVKQKATEIGMLRAIGMSDRQLQDIFLRESYFLWLRGTLMGLVFAALFLLTFACSTLRFDEFFAILGDPLSWSVFLIPVSSGLLTVVVSVCMTRSYLAKPPSSLLGLTG